ncbi:beta-ketoacyl synthase N-terminal-like domain-containing protein [Amycolatopsis sp. PS_44_ISF1]|uniref:beta-ketoacyl synthase N-terminal-like domain-containing protein n=1 Tax=Amycolatopsis sp. PS_44_ISF1 TaxID=2974917 RepID=UPI0028DDBAC8|nr:beta-ketoacyl synthase N-terminal-like domain-containing protein [Amycolatopsis sp. PS_44_ISF1]MDT8913891.1 3-oxoacyl-ACP synthase [Amycolatopsis sp. PS_44_ISF1]
MTGPLPVITAWSAVSPFGAGRDAFATGVRAGRATAAPPGPDWAVPDRAACLVPDYDPVGLVGGRVGRTTNRATVFALAAVGQLTGAATGAGERTGVVLGTTVGSLRSTMSVGVDSLRESKPHHVNTKVLPAAVMNYSAAQCAIRYGLTGPNTTIAAGRGAAVSALVYAGRLLAGGRAGRVLAGAVEEYSPERAWANHHNGGGVLGEGSVVFQVEPGGEGLAEIVAAHSRIAAGDSGRENADAAQATVSALLAQAGAAAREIWAVVPGTGAGAERETAAEMFGEPVLGRVPGLGPIGDTGASSAGFALAAALCTPGPSGRLVLVLSADPDGSAGGILLRMKGN